MFYAATFITNVLASIVRRSDSLTARITNLIEKLTCFSALAVPSELMTSFDKFSIHILVQRVRANLARTDKNFHCRAQT